MESNLILIYPLHTSIDLFFHYLYYKYTKCLQIKSEIKFATNFDN